MYDNIMRIDFRDDKGNIYKGVLVRRGAADDWAAYWIDPGQSEQSGGLVKLSRLGHKSLLESIQAMLEWSNPGLTFRP